MKLLHSVTLSLARIAVAAVALVLAPVASADLVLWLNFDDNVEDQSGSGNDGEILNDAEFGDDVPQALGGGKSLILDNGAGENQGVRVEGAEDLATEEFTLSYWIKPTALQGNAGLERLTSRGGDTFETAIGDRNAVGGGEPLTLSYYAGSWETTDVTVEEGEWSHIAWRQGDTGDLELFVNGENVFTGTGVPAGRITGGQHLNIGTRHNDVEGFEGLMDELRHYDSALSDAEIADLASPAPGLPPFVGAWKFDGDATDSSGNGNDGELVDGGEFSDDNPRDDGGKSLLLEGGAHVLVEHSESLNITDAITIAAWVKPVGEFEWDGVIAKNPSDGSDNNHAGNFELRIENGGRHLHFLHQQGGSNDTAFQQGLVSIIDPDVWTHIVVTAETENGDVNFYINGELSETLEGIITIDEFPTNENPLFIGSRADLFTAFDGLLDEVVLHNEVLDETEVENLFTNGLRAPGDSDGDGMPDEWEETYGFDPDDAADAALDADGDNLTNLQEFEKRTDPKSDDTDKDGLTDNVETNTGVWVSPTDTGTSPTKEDTDRDGLKDGVENPSLPYDPANAAAQPGTDPNKKDSDGDLVTDGSEVNGKTDPTNIADVPTVIRGGGLFTTTHVWTDGDPQLSDVFGVEEVFADPGEAEIINVEHPYIHYHDNANAPIFQDLSEPYPLWGPQGNDEGPGDRNDFAIHSVGNINITQAGEVTFACNSDDGFDLRIDGESIGEAGNRGRGNTFMTVNLTAGIHELEFLHWERGGGAGVSVYIFRSTGDAPAALNDGEWQLLEASGGGKAAFEITSVEVEGGNLVFSWPSSPGENFAVEKGSDLQNWEEVTDGHPAGDGESTEFEIELGDPAPAVLYVRVRKEG